MPPICLHLSIAREVAGLLRHPVVDQNMASYLVGAAAPDVQIIIASSRMATHFFDLEDESGESGVRLIFKAHPDLAKVSELSAATKSFVAGYLSHLVTDEVWILDIYRPFFGRSSLLGQDPTANLLDRLLQFELDVRERRDKAMMEDIAEKICEWEPNVNIGFLGSLDLRQWRDFVCTAVAREANLAFFPFFAHRFLVPKQKIAPDSLEEFLSSMPAKLEWAVQYVTPQRLAAFRQKAVSQSLAVAREYLGGDN